MEGSDAPKLPSGTVTFLFTDIEGSTQLLRKLRDRYGDAVAEHHRLLRATVEAAGGHEVNTAGDSFFFAFRRAGDAAAAAAAGQRALAEHVWPDGVRLRVRMGIHTGEPSVGGEGGYVGLGVHRAARIMALGQGGQVLVSQATRAVLEDELLDGIAIRDLGERHLKDFDRPERIYELEIEGLPSVPGAPRPAVAGPTVAEPPSGNFVGRQRELAALTAGLEEAIAGHGRVFLLAGEPGIGKTRLADELASRAGARGARVLVGRCWEAGGAPAYWPWVQSLRSYVRDVDGEELRTQLGTGGGDVAHLLPELRDLFPDLPAPAALESEGARFQLFESVSGFLRNVARERPLALVLDDLHAADEPSLLLLQFVARELGGSRLLLLGAYRDIDPAISAALATALSALAREPVTTTLSLRGIEGPDVARFIELTAGHTATGLAATVHSETEGNPLFVGEIVRLMAVEGRLEESGVTRFSIPPSVKEVIGRRLRHLSEECRGLLTVASVVGREFDLGALARLSDLERHGVLELLDEAMDARVVTEIPGTTGRLRFAHALIRDTAYQDLSRARRVELHRQVGEALEELYASDREPHLAELAHHFFVAASAGAAEKAVEYAGRAGRRAASQLAYEEAVRLYEMALELVGEDVTRCELLLALGDAEGRSGNTPGSKHAVRRAAELAAGLGLSEQLARAALGYGGRIMWEVSRDDQYLMRLLEDALAALGEHDSPLRARVLARLAGGPLRDGSFPPERKASLSQQALDMARRIGDPATVAYALDGYVPAQETPKNTRELLEASSELLDLAVLLGDKERTLEAHEHLLGRFTELGEMAAARAELAAMTQLAQELRQPGQKWLVAVCAARLALLEGRFADAERLITEARTVGESAQSWNAEVTYRLQLYVLRREQGGLGEIEELVRGSVQEYPSYPIWRCVLAHMAAELGREAESSEAFAALATNDFSGIPFDAVWLASISLLAETAGTFGDAESAATLHGLLLPYADRVAISYPEIAIGSVNYYLGILSLTLGWADDAERHFEAALEMNERIGARPWLAHTQEAYAGMLLAREAPGNRDRALELMARARGNYRDLGMNTWAERTSGMGRPQREELR